MNRTPAETPDVVEYLVIAPRIVGNPETGYRHVYDTDGHRQRSRVRAVSHGWDLYGSDDWLIGLVAGDELLRLAWMDEDRDDLEELAEAAAQLGLKVRAEEVTGG